jgi:uncharacterized delta-60 repeat protein
MSHTFMSAVAGRVLRVAVLGIVLLPAVLLADPDTAWVRRYNGPDNGRDQATAIAVDTSGNVYVAGNSHSPTTGYDWLLVKYLPNGDTAWTQRADGWGEAEDRVYAIALDTAGNAIVTGSTTSTGANINTATIKYRPDGSLVYVKEYDGPDHLTDVAKSVAVDREGNAYVTGYSEGAGTGRDWITIKYLPNGDTAWTRRADGWDHGDDVAYALALDTAGNAIVTGSTTSTGANRNTATIKYRPDGSLVYVKEYDGPTHNEDEAHAVAVDREGNAFITGASTGATSADWVTVKYLPNGDTAWVRCYNGSANGADFAYAIAVDSVGNAVAAGFSEGSGSGADWMTIKYLPNGDTAWTIRANGSANGGDVANAVAVGPTGDVFVTGYTTSLTGGINYGTMKFLSDGTPAWLGLYDGPSSGTDIAGDVVLDREGNVYVTGFSSGATSVDDYATIKYLATSGIAETPRAEMRTPTRGATIVRTSLHLTSSLNPSIPSSLLDASGRRALDLRAGPNDVSRLAPGVYFVHVPGRTSPTRVLVLR